MNGLTMVMVAVFAVLCLIASIFMPYAELGMPPGPLDAVRQSLMGLFTAVEHSPNFPYYVYALLLGAALIAAAIAIYAIGREDAEEVTVIPAKK